MTVGLFVGILSILVLTHLSGSNVDKVAWVETPAYLLFWALTFVGFVDNSDYRLFGSIVFQWWSLGLLVSIAWLYFGKVDGIRQHKRVALRILAVILAIGAFCFVVVCGFCYYGRLYSR
jgi:hypothetical protein